MSTSPSSLRNAVAALLAEPLALAPRFVASLTAVLRNDFDAAGLRALTAEFASSQRPPNASKRDRGGVALIPITGLLVPRRNLLTEFGIATSTRDVIAQTRAATADPSVRAIAFVVDSPGGSVGSIPDLAAIVREVSRQKPTVALVDGLCASAALWAVSGARSIVASSSSEVGSIGVLTTRVSLDEHLKQQGIGVTVVSAGKFKTEGLEVLPITDAEKAELQRRVDAKYNEFVHDVAAGRRVSASVVRDRFGEGRMLSAEDAQRVGLIDRVARLEDALAEAASVPSPAVGDSFAPHRARVDLAFRRAQFLAATGGRGF